MNLCYTIYFQIAIDSHHIQTFTMSFFTRIIKTETCIDFIYEGKTLQTLQMWQCQYLFTKCVENCSQNGNLQGNIVSAHEGKGHSNVKFVVLVLL